MLTDRQSVRYRHAEKADKRLGKGDLRRHPCVGDFTRSVQQEDEVELPGTFYKGRDVNTGYLLKCAGCNSCLQNVINMKVAWCYRQRKQKEGFGAPVPQKSAQHVKR